MMHSTPKKDSAVLLLPLPRNDMPVNGAAISTNERKKREKNFDILLGQKG